MKASKKEELRSIFLLKTFLFILKLILNLKTASTLCHLELADALQNLYHMVAMICSTALTRINRLVLEAQETVQKLDRAPRNKQESWHKLRKNLQVAQATLLRFERALKNHSKLVEHTKLRLQSALVEARRKQLMQIWNTINQEHLAIVSLQQSENGAELVPQIGKWEEIFRVHVSDMIPIFGLALQRAQAMVKNFLNFARLKLAGKVTYKLSDSVWLKMAERSEAKSTKRSFASKYFKFLFLLRSFASRFLLRFAQPFLAKFN